MEANLPTDLLHWLAALLPIALLLLLLVGFRWKSTEAGPVGLFAAIIISLLLFRTPIETLTVAVGKGIWGSIFILYVIWPALLLYVVADRAGKRLVNPALAGSFKRLAESGPRQGFYEGETASRICRTLGSRGSPLQEEDLESFKARWVEPISADYQATPLTSSPQTLRV